MALFARVKAEDVFRRGDPVGGRIVGVDIRRDKHGDSDIDIESYAIEVGARQPFVAGVRQRLSPPGVVRLGGEIVARHLGGRAVIDWAATNGGTNNTNAALLKEPPAPGIVDSTIGLEKARDKGVPASVTVNATIVRDFMMGITKVLGLDVTVRSDAFEAYDIELQRVVPPIYATHLCLVGVTLPAWARPDRLDRVTIDWPAAAMATPGVGEPPAAVLAELGQLSTGAGISTLASAVGASTIPGRPPAHDAASAAAASAAAASAAADTCPPVAAVAAADTPIDGVTFDIWVAVEGGLMRDRVRPSDYDTYAERYGVRPGAWTSVSAAWHQRCRSDWRLGAAFGEGIQRTRQQR